MNCSLCRCAKGIGKDLTSSPPLLVHSCEGSDPPGLVVLISSRHSRRFTAREAAVIKADFEGVAWRHPKIRPPVLHAACYAFRRG